VLYQSLTCVRTLSKQPIPQGDEAQVETEQIVKLSTAARAERERLERLRITRGPKEKVVTLEVSC
jgi:hypothetical protein